MIRELVHSFGLAHGVAAVIAGAIHFSLWRRSGFWLPGYVHGLAVAGLLIGCGIVATIPPDAPVARWGVPGQVFALLVCPALVYFFFVFHGGQAAALGHRDRPHTGS